MFTETFLLTTDPHLTLSQYFGYEVQKYVLFSIVFHTVIYLCFFNLTSFIFLGKILSNVVNQRIIVSALVIMSIGYLARVYNVKDIYQAYNRDIVKTREHIQHLFVSWVFIA